MSIGCPKSVMKHWKVLLITLAVNLMVFLAIVCAAQIEGAANKNEEPKAIKSAEKGLSTEMEYTGKILMNGSAREGQEVYEDEEYRYFYDESEDCIVGVERKEFPQTSKVLTTTQLVKIARDYLEELGNLSIVGELECNVFDFDGVQYPIEFVETLNGFETGTRAMLYVGTDGTIHAASLVQGNQYEASAEKLVTKNEAIQIASAYLKESEKSEGHTCTIAELSASGSQNTWQMSFDLVDGESAYVVIDAYSGKIISVDHSW